MSKLWIACAEITGVAYQKFETDNEQDALEWIEIFKKTNQWRDATFKHFKAEFVALELSQHKHRAAPRFFPNMAEAVNFAEARNQEIINNEYGGQVKQGVINQMSSIWVVWSYGHFLADYLAS